MTDTNRTLAQEFYSQFQATRTTLTNRLETAKSTSSSDVVQSLSQEIAQLRKSLVDNTSLLPPYDRRQCEAQMAGLEGMLDQVRTTSTSKPKFAFKRKPASKPNLPPTAGPSASATMPSVPARPLPSTYLTLSSKSHEHLTLESLPSLVDTSNTPQSDLTIADLDLCVVDLCTPKKPVEPAALGMTFTALHIRDIRDTILLLPSIKGSVLLHNATRCIIAVGCHQFRMHTSNDVDVYLSIPSNPIIEHCTRIAFASYPTHLSILTGLPSHPEHDMIVQDFSHIRPTPSPNWVAMSGDRRVQDWADVISPSRTNVDLLLEKYIPKSAEKMMFFNSILYASSDGRISKYQCPLSLTVSMAVSSCSNRYWLDGQHCLEPGGSRHWIAPCFHHPMSDLDCCIVFCECMALFCSCLQSPCLTLPGGQFLCGSCCRNKDRFEDEYAEDAHSLDEQPVSSQPTEAQSMNAKAAQPDGVPASLQPGAPPKPAA